MKRLLIIIAFLLIASLVFAGDSFYSRYGINTFVHDGLEFDGSEYVTMPENGSLDITEAITLEAWVKQTDSTSVQSLINKRLTFTVNIPYALEMIGLVGRMTIHDGVNNDQLNGVITTQLGAINHIVGTFDRSFMRLYVNGVADSSTLARPEAMPTNDIPLRIGSRADAASERFIGNILVARIYNVALTAGDVMYLAGNPTASEADIIANTTVSATEMVLYHDYRNENLLDLTSYSNNGTHSGTPNYISGDLVLWLDQSDPRSYGDIANWYDLSGLSNHGVQNTGADQPTIGGVDNLSGSTRTFDGNTEYMDLGTSNTLRPGIGDFSVLTWIKAGSASFDTVLSDRDVGAVGTSEGWWMALGNTGQFSVVLEDSVGNAKFYQAGTDQDDNIWHLLVFSWIASSETLGLYVDGSSVIPIKTNDDSLGDISPATNINIGRQPSGDNYFDGSISAVEIFSRAVTAAEVQQLFIRDRARYSK